MPSKISKKKKFQQQKKFQEQKSFTNKQKNKASTFYFIIIFKICKKNFLRINIIQQTKHLNPIIDILTLPNININGNPSKSKILVHWTEFQQRIILRTKTMKYPQLLPQITIPLFANKDIKFTI